MKWTKILPLMLCFTLVLCTVGRSAPAERGNDPSPQIKKYVAEKSCSEITTIQVAAIQAGDFQDIQITTDAGEKPVDCLKIEVASKETYPVYPVDLRRRLPDMSYKINKPPDQLE